MCTQIGRKGFVMAIDNGKHSSYENPLCTRYSSKEMRELFSNDTKFRTWKKLWIALAESEKELGINITDEQLSQMRENAEVIDYETAEAREKEVRHDVMSHIYAYGKQAPLAKPIIHLGATSCYVGDNTDIIVMRDAMRLVRKKLLTAIRATADFAKKYRDQPCLAYTHFQAAQPTTVGKRATLWANDLLYDLRRLDFELSELCFFGCKGTTGTGASFLELFEGDAGKVKELEKKIAAKMGFDKIVPVSGQTYSRKIDYQILSVLSGIAQSACKFAGDVRLLSHLKEVEEPFEAKQVGSSAMAYKRNPMRCERIASLARFVICDTENPALTAALQWFERTLDDSANRRLSLPQAFLAVDSILSLYINVVSGMKVYPKIVEKHLREELPFMATENILMHCVKKGGDRQALHEAIREHSIAAATKIKLEGADNDLISRIENDPRFGLSAGELDGILDINAFSGIAREQTDEFLEYTVAPVLLANSDEESVTVEINV